MNKRFTLIVVVLFSCINFTSLFAEDFESEIDIARKNITANIKGLIPENILPSPVAGLYLVVMPPRLFYASADGRFVLDGDLIDMKKKQNITQYLRNQALSTAVNAMGEDSMIIFGKDSLKHTVTVFTDIDCTYCLKLHSEIKQYNDLGIRIRYMAYPRDGIGSGSFNKAEAVWCSKDRQKAMNQAKNGATVKSDACNSPVAKQYTLGNMIGINATPSIVLENGTIVRGYLPPQRLSDVLNNKEVL